MLRGVEDRLRGAFFDDAAVLHDGDAVGDLRDDGQIVRDEEHGEIVGAAQVAEEGENLCLHGDVERGCGLVGDEQAGAVDDRHRDEDALALAAGELVGVVADSALGLGKSDLAHGGQDLLLDGFAGEFGVMGLDGLGDLGADGHDWVERGHGLLEDHGYVAASAAAHGGLREGEEVFAGEGDASGYLGARRKQTEQGERGGGLAGAGFADEPKGLAGVDPKGDIPDGGTMAEGYGETFHFEQGCRVHGLNVCEVAVGCW